MRLRVGAPVLALALQGWPLAAFVTGYVLSVAWNIVTTVGVWRASECLLLADLGRLQRSSVMPESWSYADFQ